MGPVATRRNPSSSDSGGVQPNKRRVFSISTCKEPHRRCAASCLPTIAAANFSQLTGTNSCLDKTP